MDNRLSAFIILILASLLVPNVQSATLTVCGSGCNSTTIQGAIDMAGSGDTIEIDEGTYNESGLKINKSLSIIGDREEKIKITGVSGFDNDLQFRKYPVASYTEMSYVVGVYNNAEVNFTNIIIDGNNELPKPTSGQNVGGIVFYNADGNLYSVILNNTKTNPEYCTGGAVTIYANGTTSTLNIEDSEFYNWGKNAVSLYGNITINVDDSIFVGNNGSGVSDGLQNGIVATAGANLTVTDSIFHEIRAEGGSYEAISIMGGYGYKHSSDYYIPADSVRVNNCTFYNTGDNYIRRTTGIWITNTGVANITSCTFDNTDGITVDGSNSCDGNESLFNPSSQNVYISDCFLNNSYYISSRDYCTMGMMTQRGGKMHITDSYIEGYNNVNNDCGEGISFYSEHTSPSYYTGQTGGSVENCQIKNSYQAIYTGTNVTPMASENNMLYDSNTYYFWNNDNNNWINITYNYFGSSTPNASKIYGNVTYFPFCINEECTENIEDEISEFAENGTTDFSKVTNWSSVSLTLDEDNGMVNWSSPINLQGSSLMFSTYINIGHNSISVDSTNMPELNQPADLTFKNSGYTDTTHFKVYRNGVICPDSICTGVSLSNGNAKVTVTQMSTYSLIDSMQSYWFWSPIIVIFGVGILVFVLTSVFAFPSGSGDMKDNFRTVVFAIIGIIAIIMIFSSFISM